MDTSIDTSKKIKEDKYKILRMSLILGNSDGDTEAVSDFETSAREIDTMNQDAYLEELDSKYYDTLSLEEEKARLEDLIAFIEGRIAQRDALKEDFYNVTGHSLANLDPIKDGDRVIEYKNRLQYINRYLDNMKVIENTTQSKEKYESDLEQAYKDKDNSEENNIKLEKDLADLFKKLVNDKSVLLRNIQEIDAELESINPSIVESKKTLNIFDKSFRSLKKAGIAGKEEKEYYSYVTNARLDYYSKMEKYYFLTLYRFIFVINSDFESIFKKRSKIKEILSDRTSLRANLEIVEDDRFSKLYNLLDQQYDEIVKEKDNIDNIESLKEKIKACEEELDNYKEDNNRPEILTLLKEFCLIDKDEDEEDYSNNYSDVSSLELEPEDTYNIDDIIKNDKEEVLDNSIEAEEENDEEKVLDNEVVSIREPVSIDIIKVMEKAKSVMLRVGKMLNPTENNNTEETKEEIPAEAVSNNDNYEEEELNLPKFDDLPTVSSLTKDGSIKNENNSQEPVTVNSNVSSFWGNDADDFEFPEINSWGDK